jgi:spore coat polysaccharide biosynthesis protein SpsF (cytidylyltransferase family)
VEDALSPGRDRVVAVVQARMSSTRLPGKVLATLGKHTVLQLLLTRLERAQELDGVIVATSAERSDDVIEQECRELSTPTVRGSLTDVLDRFVRACESQDADAVVRITADCPFADPEVIDHVVAHWRHHGFDYVSNTREPRSFPDGLDVEVVSAAALRRAAELAASREDREHVTAYIRRHPSEFSTGELRLIPNLGDMRMTLDTAEDLEILTDILAQVGPYARLPDLVRALGYDTALAMVTRP